MSIPRFCKLARLALPMNTGGTVKAYIVVKPGESLTEKEVIQFCQEKLQERRRQDFAAGGLGNGQEEEGMI